MAEAPSGGTGPAAPDRLPPARTDNSVGDPYSRRLLAGRLLFLCGLGGLRPVVRRKLVGGFLLQAKASQVCHLCGVRCAFFLTDLGCRRLIAPGATEISLCVLCRSLFAWQPGHHGSFVG